MLRYDITHLKCPVCSASPLVERADGLACPACTNFFPVNDGIPSFVPGEQESSKLEHIDYNAAHFIGESTNHSISNNLARLFSEFDPVHTVVHGDVMELGAGTGNVTQSLVRDFPFRSIHATDISRKFLHEAVLRTQDYGDRCYFYVCDANRLPFAANTFDVVIGYSVLHHFLHYQDILKQVHTILRKGGIAIFYEPVLQGKAKLAMMLQLICILENQHNLGILTPDEVGKVKRLREHLLKSLVVGNDPEKLSAMEDKYIFNVHELVSLGTSTGFESVSYRNWRDDNGYYRIGLELHLIRAGISEAKAHQFRFITRTWRENMVALLPDEQYTPMGFFIFRK